MLNLLKETIIRNFKIGIQFKDLRKKVNLVPDLKTNMNYHSKFKFEMNDTY